MNCALLIQILRYLSHKLYRLEVPSSYPNLSDDIAIQQYNTELANTLGLMTTAESPIFIVDQFTDFDDVNFLYDGLHPNLVGEQFMGQNWMNELINSEVLSSDMQDPDTPLSRQLGW